MSFTKVFSGFLFKTRQTSLSRAMQPWFQTLGEGMYCFMIILVSYNTTLWLVKTCAGSLIRISHWNFLFWIFLAVIILLKTLCRPQCSAVGHTLNFPSKIVILVNLCNPIFFSGFVLILITDQVNCWFCSKISYSRNKLYFPIAISCLLVPDISDIRPF